MTNNKTSAEKCNHTLLEHQRMKEARASAEMEGGSSDKTDCQLIDLAKGKVKEEMICDNCGMSFLKLSSTEWYRTNGCYCSSECRYEAETGHPGEQY